MLLSEAMALGPTVATLNKGGGTLKGCEGCAMGVALRAAGFEGRTATWRTVHENWPWVDCDMWGKISLEYFKVVGGHQTFEQLIDWVRSVEPAEQVPASALADAEEFRAKHGLSDAIPAA